MNTPNPSPLAVHWIELGRQLRALDPCRPEHRAQVLAGLETLASRWLTPAVDVALPWPEAGGVRFQLHRYVGDLAFARRVERALLDLPPPRMRLGEAAVAALMSERPCSAHPPGPTPRQVWRHLRAEQAIHSFADLLLFLRSGTQHTASEQEFDRLGALAALPALATLRPVLGGVQKQLDRDRARTLATRTPWAAYAHALIS